MQSSGAFFRAEESADGRLLLQATETIAGYDDEAMLKVFEALRQVMRLITVDGVGPVGASLPG